MRSLLDVLRHAPSVLERKSLRAIEIYQERGWSGIRNHVALLRGRAFARRNFDKWIEQCDRLTDADRFAIRRRIERLAYKPRISIVMPVYNTDEQWLRLALNSVLAQLYPHWELCIADDHSSRPHVLEVLQEYEKMDPRIKIVFRDTNGHISAASNSALALATGEFTAFLDHDDELTEHALYWVAESLNENRETDMLYSDEDMLDHCGQRYSPKFKPDWSPDLFYSLNLITHLSVFRTEILRKLGGFRPGVEGSQDYDMALRVIEQIPPSHIRHIPHILYHWRAIPGSVAYDAADKDYAHERARVAIRSHLERQGIQATVAQGAGELHRVIYSLPRNPPPATILILAPGDPRILRQTLDSLFAHTGYQNFDACVITTSTSQQKRIAAVLPADSRLRTLHVVADSIAAAYNRAAELTVAPVLCFLAANTRILTREWLAEMTGLALQSAIGPVGAMILYPDGTIRHAGFVLGIRNHVGHAHHRQPAETANPLPRLQVIQNVSAVSTDCMVIRREVFEAASGFDAEHFSRYYGDVDLCLRLREKRFRTVLTPYARLRLLARPRNSSGFAIPHKPNEETTRLQERWRHLLALDPHYNPNLTLQRDDFSIALPPRTLSSRPKETP